MDATSIADLGRSYVLNSNFRFIRFRFTHFDYLGGPPYRAPYATVSVSVCLSVSSCAPCGLYGAHMGHLHVC